MKKLNGSKGVSKMEGMVNVVMVMIDGWPMM